MCRCSTSPHIRLHHFSSQTMTAHVEGAQSDLHSRRSVSALVWNGIVTVLRAPGFAAKLFSLERLFCTSPRCGELRKINMYDPTCLSHQGPFQSHSNEFT